MPGTVGTAPFGSNVRAIVVNVDPDRLRSYNLTPDDVVKALTAGNVIVPAGNLYIKDQMPLVPINAMIVDIQDIGKIPVQPGRNVYIRDVATVADSTDVNFGYAMVDGHRSVYIPDRQEKHRLDPDAWWPKSTAPCRRFKSVLPEGVDIRYEFDESPDGGGGHPQRRHRRADRRHPDRPDDPALLARLAQRARRGLQYPHGPAGFAAGTVDDRQHHQHHDAGRPGPVHRHAGGRSDRVHRKHSRADDATRRRWPGRSSAAATRRPSPVLLAMLCILSVFIPAFIMAEPVRSLFVPLSLAVGFAMIASYLLSSTLVPVLSVWLLKHHGRGQRTAEERKGLVRLACRRSSASWSSGQHPPARWIVVPVYLVAVRPDPVAAWACSWAPSCFPQVDSGEFVLRFRTPPGTNYELTRQAWVRCLEVIEEEAGAGQRGDLDGLRRPASTQLRHEQHAAVHARPRRRPDARGPARRQRRQHRRVARTPAQSLCPNVSCLGSPSCCKRKACRPTRPSSERGR